MKNEKLLKVSEQKGIAETLLNWLRTCPYIPSGLKLDYQYLGNKSGLSLHTLSGTIKRVEYIDGSYEGVYPFAIYLRDIPDSNNTRLDCTDILDMIGSWVDGQNEYPDLGDNRSVSTIETITNSTLVKRFENGVDDYMITFELIYVKGADYSWLYQ